MLLNFETAATMLMSKLNLIGFFFHAKEITSQNGGDPNLPNTNKMPTGTDCDLSMIVPHLRH